MSNPEPLSARDAIRKRPGMYVGDVHDGSGLHHLAWEVVANAVDEHLAGHARTIALELGRDGSITIIDDGRGIPVEPYRDGRSVAEIALTELHFGPTFDGHARHVHVGFRGVGLVAVNAVSQWFELRVFRGGDEWHQRYERGTAVTPLRRVGASRRTGTRVAFKPDPSIFDMTSFDAPLVNQRLREIAATNPGLETKLIDRRTRSRHLRHRFPHGVASFVEAMTATRTHVQDRAVRCTGTIDDIAVDIAFKWVDRGQARLHAFANQEHCHGGTHIRGFRTGLMRALRSFDVFKSSKLRRPHVEDGLVTAISVMHFDPQWDSPTKSVLANREVVGVVAEIVARATEQHLARDPELFARVLHRPPPKATSDVPLHVLRHIAGTRDHAPKLVLADALLERGDPLGDYLTMRCALERETDAERRVALECHCGALVAQYRESWQPMLDALDASARVRSRRRAA